MIMVRIDDDNDSAPARYKQCNDQAQTFYKHAAQLVPMNGQPYNQLAILEVQKGNKLSTIFYHTRSLAVQHPFPVAEINCNKFFARISKDGFVAVVTVDGMLRRDAN